jgi:hypothetical protein
LEAEAEAASASKCTLLHHVRAEADIGDSAAAHATFPIHFVALEPAEEDAIADLKARAAAYGTNYVRLDRMTWVGGRTGYVVVHGQCAVASPSALPRLECTEEHPGLRTCVPLHEPERRAPRSQDKGNPRP